MKTELLRVDDLKVLWIHSTSQISKIAYKFHFGSSIERELEYGLCHMLEHNFFKGTQRQSVPKEITREFNEIGWDTNAFTSYFVNAYHCRGLDINLQSAFRLLSELVWTPTFPEEEWEKEKNPILNELEIYESDKFITANENILNNVYGFPLHPTLGTRKTIKKLSKKDGVDFYNKYFNKKNCLLIIETNKSLEEVMSIVSEETKDLPIKESSENLPKRIFKDFSLYKNDAVFDDVETDYVTYSFARKKQIGTRDSVLATLGDWIVGQYLYDLIRDEKGFPVYNQSLSIDSFKIAKEDFNFEDRIQFSSYISPEKHNDLVNFHQDLFFNGKIFDLMQNIDLLFKSNVFNLLKTFISTRESPFESVVYQDSIYQTQYPSLLDDKIMILKSIKKESKNEIDFVSSYIKETYANPFYKYSLRKKI